MPAWRQCTRQQLPEVANQPRYVVREATDEMIGFWRSRVSVKVTARSYIWVSCCSGWRHPRRCLASKRHLVCSICIDIAWGFSVFLRLHRCHYLTVIWIAAFLLICSSVFDAQVAKDSSPSERNLVRKSSLSFCDFLSHQNQRFFFMSGPLTFVFSKLGYQSKDFFLMGFRSAENSFCSEFILKEFRSKSLLKWM